MPVRTAYAGTALDGDVYTAANHARMPGGWLGYAEKVADQLGIGAAKVDVSGLTVTVTVGANRRIKVSGVCLIDGTDSAQVYIEADGVQVGRVAFLSDSGAPATARVLGSGFAVLTPAAGARTYKLTAQSGGADTLGILASASFPALILVEDLGPAT